MAILLQLLSPVTGYHPKITVNRSFQPGQTPQVDGYNDINVLTFVSMDILYMAVLLRLFVSKEIGKYLLTPYLLKQPSKSCIMSITPLFIFLLSTSFFLFHFHSWTAPGIQQVLPVWKANRLFHVSLLPW